MRKFLKLIPSLLLVFNLISADEDILSVVDEMHGQFLEVECLLEGSSCPHLQLAKDDLQETVLHLQARVPYNDFDTNPYFAKKEKEQIKPYLLPFNHPTRFYLDYIFSSTRVTQDSNTFDAAGFISKFIQPRSFIRVASHPYLPGYLVKVYLDNELRIKKNTPGWKWFVNRAKNAKLIRRYIRQNGFKYFAAPQKWIYPLPIHTSPPNDPGYSRKNEILIVEDMQLVSEEENLKAWKTVITKKHLEEFYEIISYAGGSSYRADNVAYTKDGKFAFIDTEYSHRFPNYAAILPYLSPEMAAYWKRLVGIK